MATAKCAHCGAEVSGDYSGGLRVCKRCAKKQKKKAKLKKGKAVEPKPTQLYLYLGLTEISKDRVRHCYLPVTEDWRAVEFPVERPDVWADEVRLYKRRFGFARPGSVISIEHEGDDDHTVYHRTAVLVGSVDQVIAASWQSTSNAIKTSNDVKKMFKKDGARDLQMEALGPLRIAYRKLRNRNQRAAFIARVSVYLTS